MQKTHNLQDLFLLRARRDQANVTMFLMNGYQLQGARSRAMTPSWWYL